MVYALEVILNLILVVYYVNLLLIKKNLLRFNFFIQVLDSVSRNNINNSHNHIPPPAPPVYQQANGQYDEDIGYRYYTLYYFQFD